MVKRKREPSLSERLAQWNKELVRAFKTAKGFERQRLSKRIREGDAAKTERLEREVAVLKSLDLHQAAHQHLCSSLLRVKGVADAPGLPGEVKLIPKPESLTEEQRTALHNVTSALCNRKQVRDVIDEAVMATCIALRVPMPEKKGRKGGAKKSSDNDKSADGGDDKKSSGAAKKEGQRHDRDTAKGDTGKDEEPESVLVNRGKKHQTDAEDVSGEEDENGDANDDETPFEGFSDSDDEERAFSRYDGLVAASSDEDSEGDAEDEDESRDSRAMAFRKTLALDDMEISSEEEGDSEGSQIGGEDEEEDEISGSEPDLEGLEGESGSDEEEEEEDDDEDSDSDVASPPRKRAKAKSAPVTAGSSAFLPTLMGGYISGSESEASDLDIAPPAKKNRRGQRARQAIWEKKYGDKAKHHSKPQQNNGRDQGWDLRRGAVEEGGEPAGPWKKGIRNPFEKNSAASDANMHPERQRALDGGERNSEQRPRPDRNNHGSSREGRGGGGSSRGGFSGPSRGGFQDRSYEPAPAKPKPVTKRDDTGPLHPSWAAAKKAKEEAGKVAFQGKKVVFD